MGVSEINPRRAERGIDLKWFSLFSIQGEKNLNIHSCDHYLNGNGITMK